MNSIIVFSTSDIGGAERSLTRMALAADGGEFKLATLDGEGPWSVWLRSEGCNPLVFGQRETGETHGRFGIKALYYLIKYIRTADISNIYVVGLRASIWIRLLKPLLKGARIVQAVRWNPASESTLDKCFRWVERLTGCLIDFYICNSVVASRTLQQSCGVPGYKIKVIFNGLNDIPGVVKRQIDKPAVILTVANFSPRKGLVEYLDVVAKVHVVCPDIRFVLAGRDDMNGRVQREIASRGLSDFVECTGYVENIGVLMDEARIFVLPSLWDEGCPTAVLEAMARGVPVVAYLIDGLPDLVGNELGGLLVPLGDQNLMVDAIVRLVRDVDFAQSVGDLGRLRAGSNFMLGECVCKHRDVMRL